jgi:hypothetical protein
MAISREYGKVNISRIGPDEPVFILRAQDKLAEAAIEKFSRLWRLLMVLPWRRISRRRLMHSDAFKSWGGRKKIPD